VRNDSDTITQNQLGISHCTSGRWEDMYNDQTRAGLKVVAALDCSPWLRLGNFPASRGCKVQTLLTCTHDTSRYKCSFFVHSSGCSDTICIMLCASSVNIGQIRGSIHGRESRPAGKSCGFQNSLHSPVDTYDANVYRTCRCVHLAPVPCQCSLSSVSLGNGPVKFPSSCRPRLFFTRSRVEYNGPELTSGSVKPCSVWKPQRTSKKISSGIRRRTTPLNPTTAAISSPFVKGSRSRVYLFFDDCITDQWVVQSTLAAEPVKFHSSIRIHNRVHTSFNSATPSSAESSIRSIRAVKHRQI
jgi:hypothetical protein